MDAQQLEELGLMATAGPFVPGAVYDEQLGWIVFNVLDVSYRAERIDDYLELLWHPYKREVVGVKLTGLTRQDIKKYYDQFQIEFGEPLPLKFVIEDRIARLDPEHSETDKLLLKFYRIAHEAVGVGAFTVR